MPSHLPGLPRFAGGAVGYAGLRRRPLHRAPAECPARRSRTARPVVRLLRSDGHLRPHPQDVLVVAQAHVGRRGSARRPTTWRCDESTSSSTGSRRRGPSWRSATSTPTARSSLPAASNFTREQYEAVVRHCQEYIKAGDIFQVVPSQRFELETTAQPFDIYRVLRVVNPSPFLSICRSATSP